MLEPLELLDSLEATEATEASSSWLVPVVFPELFAPWAGFFSVGK